MTLRAIAAVGDHLAADPMLAALVGQDELGAVRVYAGWPAELLERPSAPEFPRITFWSPDAAPVRPGIARARVQVDAWAWPDGVGGGRARLDEIDERILAVLDEQWWTDGDLRLSTIVPATAGFSSRPGAPLRRMYDIDLIASPA